jgi:hypothetical protein
MDPESARKLARMIRQKRVAALGTLNEGAPFVSMIAYVTAPDFSVFYIHASRLAQHTRDMLQNPQVGLMIAESDPGEGDPQTLARVSIRGAVAAVVPDAPGYGDIRALYLARFPAAALTFQLGDFVLYRIQAESARYVAGLGKTFNLTPQHLRQAATAR